MENDLKQEGTERIALIRYVLEKVEVLTEMKLFRV